MPFHFIPLNYEFFQDYSLSRSRRPSIFLPYDYTLAYMPLMLFPFQMKLDFNYSLEPYFYENFTMKLWLKSEYFTISETTDMIFQDIYIETKSLKAKKPKKKREKESNNTKHKESANFVSMNPDKIEKKFHSCPTLTSFVNVPNNATLKRTQSAQRFVNSKKNNDMGSIAKTITDRSDEKIKRSLLAYIETDPNKGLEIIDTLIRRNFSCTSILQVINMNKLNMYLCANSQGTFQRLFLQRLDKFLLDDGFENEINEEKKFQYLKLFLKDFLLEKIIKKEQIKEILMGIMLKIIDLLEDIDKNQEYIIKKIATILIMQSFLDKKSLNEENLCKECEEIFLKIKQLMANVQYFRVKNEETIMKISEKFVEILLQHSC